MPPSLWNCAIARVVISIYDIQRPSLKDDTPRIFHYRLPMSTVGVIEQAIEALPKEQFEKLAIWFAEKREQAVDAAFEEAIRSGAFDAMAKRALNDHASGKSRPLDEFLDRA